MNDARVLIVGDEGGVAAGWIEPLRTAGASLSVVSDGSSAVRRVEGVEPELVLLDLHLSGDLDGFDTCRAIRSRSATIVVMAAPAAGVYDEIVALALGADHFVPGDTPDEVVVARLRSLIRRARGVVLVDAVVGAGRTDGAPSRVGGTRSPQVTGRGPLRPVRGGAGTGRQLALGDGHLDAPSSVPSRPPSSAPSSSPSSATSNARTNGTVDLPANGAADRIVDGDLAIDVFAREVHVGGTPVALTRIEFDLLVALARHPRRVLTRDQLMASAWEVPFDGSHVLDAHLSRMRVKIARAGGDRVGHAVRGVGYRLRA